MLCSHCELWFADLVAKATQVVFPGEHPQWKTEDVSIQFRTLKASYKSCLVCIKLLLLLHVPSSAETTVEDAVEEILSIWTDKSLVNVSPIFTFEYLQMDSTEGPEMVLRAKTAGATREFRFKTKHFPTRRHCQLALQLDDKGRYRLSASELCSESLSEQLWPSTYSTIAKQLDSSNRDSLNDVDDNIFVRLLPGISESGLGETGMGPTSGDIAQHSDRIKRSIEQCKKYHVLCAALSEERRTGGIESTADRLLKIDFEKSIVSLVETTKHMSAELREQYITFTHCSGTDPRLVLGPKYSKGVEARLSFHNLPPLVRNVVRLCQDLDIHYLWVDSLCIIHDELDPSDWDAQSAKIHSIYGNSLINVSWGDTADMPSGYLRTESSHEGLRLDMHIDDIFVLSEVRCTPFASKRAVVPFHRPEMRTRRFILQELFLSHKAFHFGNDRRHWQCPTHNENGIKAESGSYELEHQGFDSAIRTDRSWITAFSPHHQVTEIQLDMLWEIVLSYCCDNIDSTLGQGAVEFNSYATAIEQQYQQLCRNNSTLIPQASYRYIHGCWMQDMPRWLLWYHFKPKRWPERPHITQGRDITSEMFPTWSWLSCHDISGVHWRSEFPPGYNYRPIDTYTWAPDDVAKWKAHFARKYGPKNSRATFSTFDTERLSQASTIRDDPVCSALRIAAPAFSWTRAPRPVHLKLPESAPSRRLHEPPLSFISNGGESYDIHKDRPSFSFSFRLDEEERCRSPSCIRQEEIAAQCAVSSPSANISSEQDLSPQQEFQCVILRTDRRPYRAYLEGLILAAVDTTGRFHRRAGIFSINYDCERSKARMLFGKPLFDTVHNIPIEKLRSRSEEDRLLALLLRCERSELSEFRVV